MGSLQCVVIPQSVNSSFISVGLWTACIFWNAEMHKVLLYISSSKQQGHRDYK